MVRRVSPAGIITTFAGGPIPGFAGNDGPAIRQAWQSIPGAPCTSSTRSTSESDVTPAGIINTFAGNGLPGFSGDGGPAELAKVLLPTGVVADADSVYLGDTFNHRVRRIHHGGPPPVVPEFPVAGLVPMAGILVVGAGIVVRRRRGTTPTTAFVGADANAR
jgi:hypothetical protein